jgi:hypothetical protein
MIGGLQMMINDDARDSINDAEKAQRRKKEKQERENEALSSRSEDKK